MEVPWRYYGGKALFLQRKEHIFYGEKYQWQNDTAPYHMVVGFNLISAQIRTLQRYLPECSFTGYIDEFTQIQVQFYQKN